MKKSRPKRQPLVRRFFSALGPGLVTGAADDDPSGVATYSVTGAQLGTSLLWTASLTWPLMGAVQMMCARIGMVTGRGLAGAMKQKFPRWILIIFSVALLIANTINIAADLSGMADAAEMLSGVNSHFFVVAFGAGIAWATIRLRYFQIARILKWLALVLFAYIVTALKVGVNWSEVAREAFLPAIPASREAWAGLVAILGTTISPYLFFWQAAQEVEEENAMGRRMLVDRQGATKKEIADRRLDVGVGTFFSNLVMFFIILTTALTLHHHGITHIETSRQAAEALTPFAGRFAAALYAAGVIGVGLLAIPTLSGSAAYAFAETFDWAFGLDQHLRNARYFYAVVVLSTAAGIVLDFADVNPIRALYWSAIVNGLLAPFLLIAILIVACDRKVMCGQPSSTLSRVVVGVTTAVMFAAAIGMFVF
ncbi:MAG: divalent metal cation transporter [Acidobacteria bacterium]|nr:divalent metal cation transporter [Acidobacteriota bacterium]MCA1612009.1 divalent metal cation transporter [Acidobacteriota bacterium]